MAATYNAQVDRRGCLPREFYLCGPRATVCHPVPRVTAPEVDHVTLHYKCLWCVTLCWALELHFLVSCLPQFLEVLLLSHF